MKSIQLAQKWQYLLLQEKCRLCQRLIHPFVKNMDFRRYAPPAQYFYAEKEIISDALCHFCQNELSGRPPCVAAHEYGNHDGQSTTLFVASCAVFEEPLNTIIYKFKYDGDVLPAKDMACLMLSAWTLLGDISNCDPFSLCLVPVPLHKKRQKQRGFNQSELLAWKLSQLLGIKAETKLLKRIRNTISQQELNKSERTRNVAGAFQAINDQAFAGRNVVLIDDVCTSGSTLIECAKAVAAAGALSVRALTIAYVP